MTAARGSRGEVPDEAGMHGAAVPPFANLVAACVLAFHSPDGNEFFVLRADIIRVVRPVVGYRGHLAHGTGSILYLGGPRGFAVSEPPAQVMKMIRDCEAGQRPG